MRFSDVNTILQMRSACKKWLKITERLEVLYYMYVFKGTKLLSHMREIPQIVENDTKPKYAVDEGMLQLLDYFLETFNLVKDIFPSLRTQKQIFMEFGNARAHFQVYLELISVLNRNFDSIAKFDSLFC
jgi:hypothetical protein